MTDQREVKRYQWRLRATELGFIPHLSRSGDENDVPGFGKDFYAAADFDALKAERDGLNRECEERAVAVCERDDTIKELRAERDAALAEVERLRASFKNFHRLLCERFEYVHDEQDWERDQLSLIEHIDKEIKRLRGALLVIQAKGDEHPDPYVPGSWFATIARAVLGVKP